MDKTATGVVVNYDYYRNSEGARDFVYRTKGKASLIAFVPSPDERSPDNDPNEFEWDVVISNHGNLPSIAFKVAALAALAAHSNVYPAIALDTADSEVYTEAGVLMVVEPDEA